MMIDSNEALARAAAVLRATEQALPSSDTDRRHACACAAADLDALRAEVAERDGYRTDEYVGWKMD